MVVFRSIGTFLVLGETLLTSFECSKFDRKKETMLLN
jgi:hypothetical protein